MADTPFLNMSGHTKLTDWRIETADSQRRTAAEVACVPAPCQRLWLLFGRSHTAVDLRNGTDLRKDAE